MIGDAPMFEKERMSRSAMLILLGGGGVMWENFGLGNAGLTLVVLALLYEGVAVSKESEWLP